MYKSETVCKNVIIDIFIILNLYLFLCVYTAVYSMSEQSCEQISQRGHDWLRSLTEIFLKFKRL